jgi:transposase
VSETGPDLSRFPTVKHFHLWLNLCPATRITGGKRLEGGERKRANRARLGLACGYLPHLLADAFEP